MIFQVFHNYSIFEKWLLTHIMKSSPYVLIPLHHRPDMIQQCCDLLNSEWYRSETSRLINLQKSCDDFPTCLILMNTEIVIGHCKVTLLSSMKNTCIIESVIINPVFRCQGLGSLLLKEVEKYVSDRNLNTIYLVTKGQEEFYLKNGYSICEPIDLYNCSDFIPDFDPNGSLFSNCKSDKKYICPTAPPPPPMPVKTVKPPAHILPNRTFMTKNIKMIQ